MDLFGIGQMVSGTLGLAGNIWASERAHQSVEETNAANLELAKQQNAWNIEQWNRENEYNSPKSQIQRLIDAGLNPNLAYGNVSTGNASPLTSVNLANQRADATSPAFIAGAFGHVADLLSKIDQHRLLTSQVDGLKAQTTKTMADTESILQQTEQRRQIAQSQLNYQQLLNDKLMTDIGSGRISQKYLEDRLKIELEQMKSSLQLNSSNIYRNAAAAALDQLRVRNLQLGMPADGGNQYERYASKFLENVSGGRIQSIGQMFGDFGSRLGNMFNHFGSH